MKLQFCFPGIQICFIALGLSLFVSCSKKEFSERSDKHKKLERLSAEIENNEFYSSIEEKGKYDLKKERSEIPIINKTKVEGNANQKASSKVIISEYGIKEIKLCDDHKGIYKKETITQKTKPGRGGLTQRMKLGIILASIGFLVAVLIPWPVSILGLIVFIIGVVLIIMELVNY